MFFGRVKVEGRHYRALRDGWLLSYPLKRNILAGSNYRQHQKEPNENGEQCNDLFHTWIF